MSFSQHLVLWLHVAFVIFTIGPVTLAIMSTPRYIRKRDIRILRYLTRMTFVFAIASLGVLVAGMALASMIGKAGKPWVIVSATLFIVAILLLGLIYRDQRRAIKALEAGTAAGVASEQASAPLADQETGTETPAAPASPSGTVPSAGPVSSAGTQPAAGSEQAAAAPPQATKPSEPAEPAGAIPAHLASVERGRIAMIGGVVSLIWLVVLVLMAWNS
ncbi:MAG TPA: hypothetical protein VEM58_11190 [Streptosporangiaceae bacterium]|nr:hypothetical protein [Streptosporangiaceae bacterium]